MIQDTVKIELLDDSSAKILNKKFTMDVAEHVQSISLQLHHTQSIWGTYLVYDSIGQLRAQYLTGKTPQPVMIHEQPKDTSPYTIGGSIAAGTWTIDFIAVVKQQEEMGKPFLEVQFNGESNAHSEDELYWNQLDEGTLLLATTSSEQVIKPETRWYKGDLHTHTIYSDGQMTREENMVSAKNRQLDFFVATDHNIVPTSWVNDSSILVLPGIEVTAPLGHFNIVNTNTSPFVKNRLEDMLTEQGMNKIINGHYGNALISINHPFLTEWKWLLKDTPLHKVDTLEIWNDPTYADNPQATEWALTAWDILLKDGHKITGVGGSDSHLKPDERYEGSEEASLIGDPGTFVYCEGLSIHNLMKALKKGHVFVSRGEQINFQLDRFIAGDQCNLRTGKIEAKVQSHEPVEIEWIVDGRMVSKESGNQSSFGFDWDENTYHYIRVNVRKEDGTLYGFTNPIYFNDKRPSLHTWGQLLELMKVYVND
ncbi:CehA/McbA family metallohydrolase [Sporosarcina sp. FSL K6-2383]|uniref:CehA/McbA family metallohydrolase n=1 Tax=Sporosarcina sp. FSL K6-2383 TaxID=2921556 RepID=UPI00315B3776